MAWNVYPNRLIRLPEENPWLPNSNLDDVDARSIVGVTAQLEEAGDVAARATLTRSLVPGMHGWQKKIDTRVSHVVVTGPDFEWWVHYDPKAAFIGSLPQQLVAAINNASRAATPLQPAQQAPAAAPDPLDQLRKLAELRDAGIVTQQEFGAQKARILA
jgi:hypothetical protein